MTTISEGFTIRADPAAKGRKIDVDIIAVQGLGSNPEYTWKHRDVGVLWLRDLLPEIISNARIATYSYTSDVWRKKKQTTIRKCGEQFLNQLRDFSQTNQGPLFSSDIAWEALVIASIGQEFQSIKDQMVGVVFLGAPHEGAEIARLARKLLQPTRIFQILDTGMLKSLESKNEGLYNLSRDFWSGYGNLDIVCFYETDAKRILGAESTIVNNQSASIQGKRRIYLTSDHSGLNKFSGPQDPNFKLISDELQNMVSGAKRRNNQFGREPLPQNITRWLVPRNSTSLITGRSEILERMLMLLCPPSSGHSPSQKRFVISGIGGTGKSEIALRFAEDNRERFWGIFWVDVSTDTNAQRDFKDIGTRCLLPEKPETLEEVKIWLSNTNQTWLIILDNADDPMMDYSKYFPSGSRGSIILTTRLESCHRLGTVGFEALKQLEYEKAIELLLKSAEVEDESQAVLISAKAIVDELGSHTLAVVHAGVYIQQGKSFLYKYLSHFQHQQERLMKFRPTQANSTYGNVFATFEVSALYLANSKKPADHNALVLLEFLAFMDIDDVPLEILERACDYAPETIQYNEEEESTIHCLTQHHFSQLSDFLQDISEGHQDPITLSEARSSIKTLSLISVNKETGNMSMHPLVHQWARERLSEERRHVAKVAAGCVLDFSMHKQEYEEFWLHLQAHAESYVNRYLSSRPLLSVSIVQMLWWLVFLFLWCGSDAENVLVLEAIYSWQELSQKLPRNDEAFIWRDLDQAYIRRGHFDRGIKLLEFAVESQATNLEDDQTRLRSQNQLAKAYLDRGDIKQAIELFRSVVKIQERTLKEEHPDRLASQHELARAYLERGDIEQAIELLEGVVKIRERTLKKEHLRRLTSQYVLADAYLEHGDVEKAIELLELVVRIRQKILKEDHPDRRCSEEL